jgi:hypothetical protein
MEALLKTEDGPDNFLNVFLLVVSRNDYDAVTLIHMLIFKWELKWELN